MVHIVVLSEPQNHRCCYCGHRMGDVIRRLLPFIPSNTATKEHIIPRSWGGETTRENLAAACAQCNCLRGNMDYVAFSNLMKKWFARDPTLRARWHSLDRAELNSFRQICLNTQERQLRGLGQRYSVYRDRHHTFMMNVGHRLQKRA